MRQDALIGRRADWPEQALLLRQAGLLGAVDQAKIEPLWWYGKLIGNRDMHAGNLSFRPLRSGLELAPAYDMLPMLYAPLPGGELAPARYEAPLLRPEQRGVWQEACVAALAFWERAAADVRISAPFRELCAANRRTLLETAELA